MLPLKIETGRFLGLNVEDRLCQVCDQNAVENEIHFLLHCTLYDDLRRAMIVKSEGILDLEHDRDRKTHFYFKT